MAYADPEAQKQYAREHYARNKTLYKRRALEYTRKQRDAIRAYLLAHLEQNPCVDCGETDPVVLEFDHQIDKSFALGRAVSHSYGLKKIEMELEKCEVRCANCHRRKTAHERGWYRAI